MSKLSLGSIVSLLMTAALAGCTPSGGNNNGPGGSVTVAVPLGDVGKLDVGTSGVASKGGSFDIQSQLPSGDVVGASLSIDAADITIGTATDQAGTNGLAAQVNLQVGVAPTGGDACAQQTDSVSFQIDVGSSGAAASVSPTSMIVGTNGAALLESGQFGLCLTAESDTPVSLTVASLNVIFELAGDVTAASCDEILALPEVQAAIVDLASNGVTFALPAGASLPDITGTYAYSQTTTFDPDGANTGDTKTGSVTLANQTSTTIQRSGFSASIDQFIVGNATTVGFCTIDRTNDSTCDQTIARLESMTLDPATGNLDGAFLSVAVRRHAYTDPTCGARGDFIYGDVSLTAAQAAQFAQVIGKISLPQGFVPGLMQVAPDGQSGVVAGADSGAVYQFQTADPFSSAQITLPADLTPLGFSGLGYSRAGDKLAVVTDQPDAAVIYDNMTLSLIRETSQTVTADYIGGTIDFNSDGTQLYVPTTDASFADRLTVLRATDSSLGDEVRRLSTPQGKVPVQARVSPDGSQVAVLLEAGATVGEAGQLTFLDTARNAFSTPPIDLVTDGRGTVLASEVVWAPDGSLVFLAGLGAVLAVEPTAPYGITRIDVSEGAGDNPVALALSNDGQVLAVAVDDSAGTDDFAVISVATLAVLNAQNLGLTQGGAIDIEHFRDSRLAIVANADSYEVAVQTETPYAASDPIPVADQSGLTTLGTLAAADGVIAVTNIDEPAVYVLGPG